MFSLKEIETIDQFLANGRFELSGDGAIILANLRNRIAEEHQQQQAAEVKVRAKKETADAGVRTSPGDSPEPQPNKR
jgi:hypothetical protein